MKQFGKILKFELLNYFKNKIFVGITVFLVAAVAIVMFFPMIKAALVGEGEPNAPKDLPVMLISSETLEDSSALKVAFTDVFSGYDIRATVLTGEEIEKEIADGSAECAFLIKDLTSYTYYVNNLSLYDTNTATANEVLVLLYRMGAMVDGGISVEDASDIMSTTVECETVNLGKDQMQNFFYTYIMIFALYMVILLYGQMVATNVASEKSSRAMELLITSADPVAMMFGKVIASSIAGLLQLTAIFGTSLICFNLTEKYWADNMIMASIFDIPPQLLAYMLTFFLLGFLIYAFMFGAIGSTASKIEDVNTSVLPLTFLFIAGFMVVMFSVSGGKMDTLLLKICSFIPFFSPMAMFSRIAMSTVPTIEIVLSILILAASVVIVGIISAKVYRLGVLLYGTPPKITAIFKELRKMKK